MPDLVLHNANVITMDPRIPRARYVAVKNGKIQTVSGKENIPGSGTVRTKIIDCRGRTVIPGFIDAHCHLQGLAESLVCIDLSSHERMISIPEIQKKIHDDAEGLSPGAWIRVKGYHEFNIKEKRHPDRHDLDQAAQGHPVKMTHRSGHAHVLNSLGLKRAGISIETPDPLGGLIDRDIHTGEPTGILYEMGDYLSKEIPPLKERELDKGAGEANRMLLSLGITTLQDASGNNSIEKWNRIRSWQDRNIFRPRVNMMLGSGAMDDYKEIEILSGPRDGRLQLKGIKIILDETTGSLHPLQSELDDMVLKAHMSGHQISIHAIEERAISSACDAVEHAIGKRPGTDHRHRIEHCSLCSPALAERIASLRIVVVTQPNFIHYNGDRYLTTVSRGDHRDLYRIKTLLDRDVEVAFGSDFPFTPPYPVIGIYSAVTRSTLTGKVISPAESISPITALELYTCRAAMAMFEEDVKGSIAPGMVADLVVLDRDLTAIPFEEIREVRVEMTIINGDVVWEESN